MTRALRLWVPLVVPTAAFGAAGAFGWWMGFRMCTAHSPGVTRAITGIVMLAMVGVASTALAIALTNYREASAAAHAAGDRIEFMALAGVFVSVSFVVSLIWFALNALFISACGGMR